MAYFNHSAQPNCIQLWDRCTFDEGQEMFVVAAASNISRGDELTVDYDRSVGYEANGREGHVHRFLELCDSVGVQKRPSRLTAAPLQVDLVPPFETELLLEADSVKHEHIQKELLNESKGNIFFVALDGPGGVSMGIDALRFEFEEANIANRRLQQVFRTSGKIHNYYFSSPETGAFLDLGPCSSHQREGIAPDGREGFVQECEFGTIYAVPQDITGNWRDGTDWRVWHVEKHLSAAA
jgi:hypothetical protein